MGIRGDLRRDSKHRVLRAGESMSADIPIAAIKLEQA